MIDPTWITERLAVRDSVAEDVPRLQLVLESISDTLRLEGRAEIAPDEMCQIFLNGDLPPHDEKDRYRLQTISRKDSGEIIGYLSLYHGYPDSDTLYVGSLSICRDCQGKAFGAEIVERMPFLEGLKDYPVHRLVVTVRNWGAVRFRTRHGFTHVVRVEGYLHSGDGPGARLEVTRFTAGFRLKRSPRFRKMLDKTKLEPDGMPLADYRKHRGV